MPNTSQCPLPHRPIHIEGDYRLRHDIIYNRLLTHAIALAGDSTLYADLCAIRADFIKHSSVYIAREIPLTH